jgi:hypothetical protein
MIIEMKEDISKWLNEIHQDLNKYVSKESNVAHERKSQ